METPSLWGLSGTPAKVSPLPLPLALSPDRSSKRRNGLQQSPSRSPIRSGHPRDSSVYDKISQFNSIASLNSMSHHLLSSPGVNGGVGGNAAANVPASMTKQLERKTADAALQRAMIGREQAETEMHRYRDEARLLRRQLDEGRDRERKVGERLETVMENYGRAKETYSHTQAVWEKEIRRARKESFKSQTSVVKLQEEVKAAQSAAKASEEVLAREMERIQAREQEAFTARYQLVSVQERLEQALQRIRLVEQERDAFKTLAKNEEVARIAAQGHLPLPTDEEENDEFASPRKECASPTAELIMASAASEAEMEGLTRLWQWERQRADRTQDRVDFLELECELRCCPCAQASLPRRQSVLSCSSLASSPRKRQEPVAIVDAADLAILGQKPGSPVRSRRVAAVESTAPRRAKEEGSMPEQVQAKEASRRRSSPLKRRDTRRSTIFQPAEGTFRTVTEEELESTAATAEPTPEPRTIAVTTVPADGLQSSTTSANSPTSPTSPTSPVDGPDQVMGLKERMSLISLVNAPHSDAQPASVEKQTPTSPTDSEVQPETRPHSCADFYSVKTTTIPIQDENDRPGADRVGGHLNRVPSFDVNNPALTTTMTREQALAQIRERRGRAKSALQGTSTPRKQQMVGLGERRDVSAPVGRVVKRRS